jgi:hypothetical protein
MSRATDSRLSAFSPPRSVRGRPPASGPTYYFTVLVPGHQNGGFIDGAEGNLSDTTAGGTPGDLGSGDLFTNREFTISPTGVITNLGTHMTGTSSSRSTTRATRETSTSSRSA